jgi:hypothetical protein
VPACIWHRVNRNRWPKRARGCICHSTHTVHCTAWRVWPTYNIENTASLRWRHLSMSLAQLRDMGACGPPAATKKKVAHMHLKRLTCPRCSSHQDIFEKPGIRVGHRELAIISIKHPMDRYRLCCQVCCPGLRARFHLATAFLKLLEYYSWPPKERPSPDLVAGIP